MTERDKKMRKLVFQAMDFWKSEGTDFRYFDNDGCVSQVSDLDIAEGFIENDNDFAEFDAMELTPDIYEYRQALSMGRKPRL